jgi:hypothetical protein
VAFIAACAAGAMLRHAVLERRYPRTFSYSIESCFRYRYAEMRMRGKPVPDIDPAAQWPEGFDVRRTILPLPDIAAAPFYRVRGGGDPFLASRATTHLPVGLNGVRGRGYNNFDASLSEDFRLRLRLNLKAEAQNLCNRAELGSLTAGPVSSLFGSYYQDPSNVGLTEQRRISPALRLAW